MADHNHPLRSTSNNSRRRVEWVSRPFSVGHRSRMVPDRPEARNQLGLQRRAEFKVNNTYSNPLPRVAPTQCIRCGQRLLARSSPSNINLLPRFLKAKRLGNLLVEYSACLKTRTQSRGQAQGLASRSWTPGRRYKVWDEDKWRCRPLGKDNFLSSSIVNSSQLAQMGSW